MHGQKENTSDLTVITSCDIVYSVVAGKTFHGNLYFFLLLLTYNGLFPALAVTENSVSPKKAVHFKSVCKELQFTNGATAGSSHLFESYSKQPKKQQQGALYGCVMSGDSHRCNAVALNMGTEGWEGIRFIK